MPIYEYRCENCLVIYQMRQGMNDAPIKTCPECKGPVEKMVSAPNLNTRHYSSPTEEKYDKMSHTEEIAREREALKEYNTIWMPPGVKG